MSPLRTPSCVFLFSLLAGPVALAQTPNAINVDSGCGQGKASVMAKRHCGDFEVGDLKGRDPVIKAAYDQCLVFYETALQMQNTFCSYRKDAVIFAANSEAAAEAEEVGSQNVSEEAVAKDNRKVAEITKGYIAKIGELAPKLKKSFEDYIGKVGKMNGSGGSDEFYESTCAASMVTSTVPGYLRQLLAAAAHGTSQITFDSMWRATRENMRKLQEVKEEAEENATLAEMRAVQVGKIFKESVEATGDGKDTRVPLTPLGTAFSGAMPLLFKESASIIMPKIPVGAAAIVGGGVVLIYHIATNKKIQYPETAATFIGMLNPIAGVGATFVVALAREIHANLLDYRKFAHKELAGNLKLTPMELISRWGKSKGWEKCEKNAAEEQACIEKRKTRKAYENDSCSRSPIFGNGSNLPNSSSITGPKP